MSKEFIDERIDACHTMLEEGDFENIVQILKLIGEIRIHDKEIKEKLTTIESLLKGFKGTPRTL